MKFIFNKFVVVKKVAFRKKKIIKIFVFILKNIEINSKFIVFSNFKKKFNKKKDSINAIQLIKKHKNRKNHKINNYAFIHKKTFKYINDNKFFVIFNT